MRKDNSRETRSEGFLRKQKAATEGFDNDPIETLAERKYREMYDPIEELALERKRLEELVQKWNEEDKREERFCEAVRDENFEVVEDILESLVQPDDLLRLLSSAQIELDNPSRPLEIFVINGQNRIISRILDIAKADKEILENFCKRNDKGQTLLHIAAAQGYLELVPILLGAGIDPKIEDEDGKTAAGLLQDRYDEKQREFWNDAQLSGEEQDEEVGCDNDVDPYAVIEDGLINGNLSRSNESMQYKKIVAERNANNSEKVVKLSAEEKRLLASIQATISTLEKAMSSTSIPASATVAVVVNNAKVDLGKDKDRREQRSL